MIKHELSKLKAKRLKVLEKMSELHNELNDINTCIRQYTDFDQPEHEEIIAIIKTEMCIKWKIKPDQLCVKDRHIQIVMKRHIFRWVLRKYLNLTMKRIGKITKCDHVTVIHSVDNAEWYLKYPNEAFTQAYYPVKDYIENLTIRFPELKYNDFYKKK